MKLVIIESPLGSRVDGTRCSAEEFADNVAYARECLADSLRRGEAPYASHLLYPQCLNDATPAERKQGIEAGFAWGKVAALRVVYTDHGITSGMKQGIERSELDGVPVEYRKLTP